MGKGDKKTKKGKIAIGSYGNSRKRGANTTKVTQTQSKKTAESAESDAPAKPKKTPRKKSEA